MDEHLDYMLKFKDKLVISRDSCNIPILRCQPVPSCIRPAGVLVTPLGSFPYPEEVMYTGVGFIFKDVHNRSGVLSGHFDFPPYTPTNKMLAELYVLIGSDLHVTCTTRTQFTITFPEKYLLQMGTICNFRKKRVSSLPKEA